MMRKWITGFSFFCFFTCSYLSWAQNTPVIEEPLEFSNSRLSALGGYHAALADDVMTIFNNPAGFHSLESEFLISQVTLGITGPIFATANTLLGSEEIDIPEIVAIVQGLYASIDIVGPLSLAYVGSGLSFGLFNWADISFEPRGAFNLEAIVIENLLLTGGYAFRIPIGPANLDLGLQLKALFRGSVIAYNSVIEVAAAAMGGDYLSLLMDNSFIFHLGAGLDLGLLYSVGEIFSFGVAARNLYTPTSRNLYTSLDQFLGNDPAAPAATREGGIVPLDLSAGIKITPSLGLFDRYISELKILLDYNDILDFITHPATAKHWLLHLGLAMEMNLLEALFLRGGFSDGLFCAGIGLDLSIFQLNVSMFGSELSAYPGLRPAYNLVIGLEFKI